MVLGPILVWAMAFLAGFMLYGSLLIITAFGDNRTRMAFIFFYLLIGVVCTILSYFASCVLFALVIGGIRLMPLAIA